MRNYGKQNLRMNGCMIAGRRVTRLPRSSSHDLALPSFLGVKMLTPTHLIDAPDIIDNRGIDDVNRIDVHTSTLNEWS